MKIVSADDDLLSLQQLDFNQDLLIEGKDGQPIGWIPIPTFY